MISYEIVNMFADQPFAGSALGVVPDAAGLSAKAMRAIAAEINVTETAFVLGASALEGTYGVRVFTPAGESPYGGHSSVGTAATLVRLGVLQPGPVMQECGPARQPLMATAGEATIMGYDGGTGPEVDAEPLLAATGLAKDDMAGAGAGLAGFGAQFTFLPVHEPAVALARPDYERLNDAGLGALCLVSRDLSHRTYHTRLFAPGFGIPEDPACSPVAMALGAWLLGAGWLPGNDSSHGYVVRQGAEVGRPATLSCAVTVRDGRVTKGTVTGQVIPVARGEISVPSHC